jgi:hypothetical protein
MSTTTNNEDEKPVNLPSKSQVLRLLKARKKLVDAKEKLLKEKGEKESGKPL